jgi:hypothetical protein
MAIQQVGRTEGQVRAQLRAMRSERFELLLLHFGDKTQGSIITCTPDEIVQRLSWLKAQNVKGQNINIRPTGTHLSLLDDLTLEQVSTMEKTGYQPSVIVETSPNNYQAWLDHGRDLSDDEATAYARILAEQLGSDVGAAGRRHAGRLAGFTNRKPSRRLNNGLFPFVRLHFAKVRTFEASSTLTLPTPPKPIPPSQPRFTSPKRLKTIQQFHDDARYQGDYSRSDFAFAIYAHSHNMDEQQIIESILARDMSKKGNAVAQRKYAQYTSRRARKQVRS